MIDLKSLINRPERIDRPSVKKINRSLETADERKENSRFAIRRLRQNMRYEKRKRTIDEAHFRT